MDFQYLTYDLRIRVRLPVRSDEDPPDADEVAAALISAACLNGQSLLANLTMDTEARRARVLVEADGAGASCALRPDTLCLDLVLRRDDGGEIASERTLLASPAGVEASEDDLARAMRAAIFSLAGRFGLDQALFDDAIREERPVYEPEGSRPDHH